MAPFAGYYPGDGNLSSTAIFLDGERVDLSSSVDGTVNTTTSFTPLKVGASSSGANEMTGWLDEVRVSAIPSDYHGQNIPTRIKAWDLLAVSHARLPDRSGLACGYQCYGGSGYQYELSSSECPPATSYSISNSNLPGGLNFNVSNGILSVYRIPVELSH